ncbi:M67 family metallopeptidase [Qipengyuania sp. G39]|uniref:M67 family metallopeptidase n=1 Tax=Qipengyuania profundimaris TaxID=3067652 RepID=A0ABT9HMS5_9SPHN|nr:M67 family metallopeptidase [Qipengyuania sp. G39]MDP4574454.1 M67 family metallopeptidase [Qipengyuania sp. G39]
MTVDISSALLDQLLAEAEAAHPCECCGILLGESERIGAILPAANVHPDPATHFEIDPQTLIDAHCAARAGDPQVVGYYHSHPNGRAEPSATDAALAAGDGMVWAIIAAGRVAFWRSGDAGFEALPYVTSPR